MTRSLYRFVFTFSLGVVCVSLLVGLAGCREQQSPTDSFIPATKGLSLHQISQLPPLENTEAIAGEETPLFPVLIRQLETPRIVTDQADIHGRQVSIACGSCHGNLPANPTRRSAEGLVEFHQQLTFNHGPAEGFLSCLTCHNQDNYNQLRLADGTGLAFRDVQQLCAQCHSKQNRDYEHGAHGGMNGYWDRTRGPQTRKTCIECHDPHSPKFPSMIPTFKPN